MDYLEASDVNVEYEVARRDNRLSPEDVVVCVCY